MALIYLPNSVKLHKGEIFEAYSKYCFQKIIILNIFANMSLQRLHFDSTWGGMSIKNRSRTDIAVDILRGAMKGSNKSRIVCEANVNFNIATKYLDMLKDKELIIHENGLFITNDKGKVFQETAKELNL